MYALSALPMGRHSRLFQDPEYSNSKGSFSYLQDKEHSGQAWGESWFETSLRSKRISKRWTCGWPNLLILHHGKSKVRPLNDTLFCVCCNIELLLIQGLRAPTRFSGYQFSRVRSASLYSTSDCTGELIARMERSPSRCSWSFQW
jgi:hypothetical protein